MQGKGRGRSDPVKSCAKRMGRLEKVEFGGTDKIVLRQPADGMRRERDVTVVISDAQIRVMILGIRDMRQGVDEAHGAVEILELERALQALRVFGDPPILVQLLAKSFAWAGVNGGTPPSQGTHFLADRSFTPRAILRQPPWGSWRTCARCSARRAPETLRRSDPP